MVKVESFHISVSGTVKVELTVTNGAQTFRHIATLYPADILAGSVGEKPMMQHIAELQAAVISMLTEDGQISSATYENIAANEIAAAKQQVKVALVGEANRRLGGILAEFPEGERQSWNQQLAEARAVKAGQLEDVTILPLIAELRMLSVSDLADRVIAKAGAFSVLAGSILGTRQALEDRVDAATSLEELAAIVWPPDLTVEN